MHYQTPTKKCILENIGKTYASVFMNKQMFLVSIFLFFSVVVFADEPVDTSNDDSIDVNAVAETLRQKMARSWKGYEVRISHCLAIKKQTEVPIFNLKKLEELQFEKKEFLYSIEYLSRINYDECVVREQGKLLIDYSRFQYFLKQNNVDIPIELFKSEAGVESAETDDDQDVFDAIDALLFPLGGEYFHYTPEITYLHLTTQQKEYLEQVIGKKMFQVFDAFRNVYPKE